MIKVEVCINCDRAQGVCDSVGAAYLGGASTVELCSAMQFEGLTPKREHIVQARKAFKNRPGLFVMIRPRAGDFCYTESELQRMQQQISMAAEAGADGIVLGVLQEDNNRISVEALEELVKTSRSFQLKVAFHRAFDVTPDSLEALDVLIESGVDRILTSGTPWGGKGTALSGISKLKEICERAGDRIEILIGGGINSGNVGTILRALPITTSKVSVHAYSGVQENGVTTVKAVETLVRAVQEVQS